MNLTAAPRLVVTIVALLSLPCLTHPAHAQTPAAIPPAIYFGPTQPDGVKRGNWIQTMPDKGWFTILRLYSPLEPFFNKTWRPSEIEVVK